METAKKQKKLGIKEAYVKAAAYCAYQERTQQHVRDKLFSYGLHSDDVEELISKLITDNYINEERYAKTYAGGKFRIKKWGRNKIRAALKFEGISDYCIKKGIAEIAYDDYELTIKKIITERYKKETEKNPLKLRFKVAAYLIFRGYENDLVWDLLNDFEK